MGEKYVRLNSKLNSIAAFWSPNSPDDTMTGNLTVDDDGIEFITSPEYARGAEVGSPDLGHINHAANPKIAVLHGFFDAGDCTLMGVKVVNNPGLTSYLENPQSIISTKHRAITLISGMHTGDAEDKCVDSARYTFTSLAEWLITPFTEEWSETHVNIRVPLEETGVLDFCTVSSRVRIELKVGHELTTGEELISRLTRPIAFVEVTPAESASLSWFVGIGNRLENLFSLLTGTSLGMETFFIYREGRSGTVIRKQHEYVRRYEFLSGVRCTHSQFAYSIATWICESDRFREIENLLLGVLRKGKLFVETEFLSLAQALEGFHRATGQEMMLDKAKFKALRKEIEDLLTKLAVDAETAMRINSAVSLANQTSFRSRLKELCGRVSGDTLEKMKIVPEEFAGQVMRMRNFFTHAGSSYDAKEEPFLGGELFLLSQKMRALLRGVFLLHLGFLESQVAELITREATKWTIDK